VYTVYTSTGCRRGSLFAVIFASTMFVIFAINEAHRQSSHGLSRLIQSVSQSDRQCIRVALIQELLQCLRVA